MKSTIDGAGRVVIPKAIRERAGLAPGIAPPSQKGKVIRKDGLLVWDPGPNAPPFDVLEAIEQARREKEDEILKGGS
jgi:bifunctional DNA-binding transcriptional regulator/antitoxin component of YhaV-PrlF toxin-antitoxin module